MLYGAQMTPAERARAMADHARLKENPRRERWSITKPGGITMEVHFNPPALYTEVLSLYPGCGAIPIDRESHK